MCRYNYTMFVKFFINCFWILIYTAGILTTHIKITTFYVTVIGLFVIPHFTAVEASVRMGVFREIEYISKMPIVQI